MNEKEIQLLMEKARENDLIPGGGLIRNAAAKAGDVELLKAMAREHRHDYARCAGPECNEIICTIAGTREFCPRCRRQLAAKYAKVKEGYRGSRLYGAFRRAGLSIEIAKKFGY